MPTRLPHDPHHDGETFAGVRIAPPLTEHSARARELARPFGVALERARERYAAGSSSR